MGLALSPPIHIIQYYIVFGTGVYQVVAIYVSVALWLHNVLLFTWVSPSGCTSSCYLRRSRPLGAQFVTIFMGLALWVHKFVVICMGLTLWVHKLSLFT